MDATRPRTAMRYTISILLPIIVLFLLIGNSIHGQETVSERIQALQQVGVEFDRVALFTKAPSNAVTDTLGGRALKERLVLSLEHEVAGQLLGEVKRYISIELPSGDSTITMDLELVDLFSEDLKITTSGEGTVTGHEMGRHYQGAVRHIPGAMAAISIFNGEVIGLVAIAGGQLVLARPQGATKGLHLLYHDQALLAPAPGLCGGIEGDKDQHPEMTPQPKSTTASMRCVRYYWEMNYNIFQASGSLQNTINFTLALFNQSSILFANEAINIQLSEIFIWTTASPFISNDSAILLNQFGSVRTTFNGDLAHLIGLNGGGGRAYLNGLCSSSNSTRMAYSGISMLYQMVPTYSWSVNVVAHEQGHNLGSKHTHDCVWNGNNTRIDGCGPAANAEDFYNCPIPPVMSADEGGTVMSYCHLTGAGIQLANGFGPQPGAVMRNLLNSVTCLSNCNITCGIPQMLEATDITSGSALLSWNAVQGATSYALRWRAAGNTLWNLAWTIQTSHPISGLIAGTDYEYMVLTICNGAVTSQLSEYSDAAMFSTPVTGLCLPPEYMVVSAITPTTAILTWGPSVDATSYQVQWRSSGAATWNTWGTFNSTSTLFTALLPNSTYEYRVITNCASGASEPTEAGNFTTSPLPPCTDILEPNDMQAVTIPVPGTFQASLSTPTDWDLYSFTTTQATTITITLSDLPANYNITVYDAGFIAHHGSAPGLLPEVITLVNAPPGFYFFHIFRSPGATAVIDQCYTVSVQFNNAPACPVPVIVSTSAAPNIVCLGGNTQLAVQLAGTGAYCIPGVPGGVCGFDPYISNVTLGSINSNSACTRPSSYTDHTSVSAALVVGAGSNGMVTLANSYQDDQIMIWIDWNQDGDFHDMNEQVHYSTGSGPHAFTVTPPAYALNGATRMRVRLVQSSYPTPCGQEPVSDAKDYTVVVSGGQQPVSYSWTPTTYLNNPASRTPFASGVAAPITYTVTATAPGGCSAQSVVHVNTTTGPEPVPATVSPDTICENGTAQLLIAMETPLIEYCVPGQLNGVCGIDEHISHVSFGAIDHASGCGLATGYEDHTAISTNVQAGLNGLTGSVTVPVAFPGDQVRIWFDWNRDGLFAEDASEMVIATGGLNNWTFSVNVPAQAINGPTRMRVRLSYADGIAACGDFVFGETEDYTVVVVGGVPEYTYVWSPTTHLDDATSASPLITGATQSTQYSVSVNSFTGCSWQSSTQLVVTPAPVELTVQAEPVAVCPGGNVQLAAIVSSEDIQVVISGPEYLDEVTWILTNSLGMPIASGGPYEGIGGSFTHDIPAPPDGPFTFELSTVGIYQDNIANYSIRCSGSELLQGTVFGGSMTSVEAFSCSDAHVYSWTPASGMADPSSSTPEVLDINAAAVFPVSVTLPGGCVLNSSTSVSMRTPPEMVISMITENLCEGAPIQMMASAAQPGLQVVITGSWYMDEIGWNITDALGVMIASGDGYPEPGTYVHDIGSSVNGPFTFHLETFGTFNDNSAEYAINCGGVLLHAGTVQPASSASHDDISCSANFTYSWTPAAGLDDATVQDPVILDPQNGDSYTVEANSTTTCPATGVLDLHSLTAPETVASGTTVLVLATGPQGVAANSSSLMICPGEEVDLSATGSYQSTILSEDFEGQFNNWTIANNSVGGFSPAAAAWTLQQSPHNYSYFDGGSIYFIQFSSNDGSRFYLSNSRAQGSGSTTNTTLTSPGFDLSGYGSASLNFHHYFRSSATSLAKVQVTVDGVQWNDLETYTTIQGTSNAFTNTTLDLTPYVGESEVQIRFLYNGEWSWYWAVDNVTITGMEELTFSWLSEPAGLASTAQDPMDVVVAEETTYMVTVTGGPQGCSATASVIVAIDPTDTDQDGIIDCVDSCPLLVGDVGSPCDPGIGSGIGIINEECICEEVPVTDLVHVRLKAILDGAYVSTTSLMRDNLRTLAAFPLTQPYNFAPFNHAGAEQILSQVLQTTGNDAIVDWVLVELRGSATPNMITARKAALIQRDGDIVDLDGTSDLLFEGIPAGNYHLAVRHRNHLGVMITGTYAPSAILAIVDLASPATATHGTNSRRTSGSVMTLWGGNSNSNTTLNYIGLNNDRQVILNSVGATTPNGSLSNVYHRSDANMNGTVNYIGLNNDRQYLLNNVGATTPNGSRTQQLP